MKNDYLNWLKNIVEEEEPAEKTYGFLFSILYETVFIPRLRMDDDRVQEALELRKRYFKRENKGSIRCTVLELMIALSESIFEIMIDEDHPEYSPRYFFWKMVDNLGLTKFDDDYVYNDWKSETIVEDILERWIEGDLSYNGQGGLFPLRNPREDQRYVDIWYQAQSWLIENFG